AIQKGDNILVSFELAKQLSTSDKKELTGFELVNDKGIYIQSKAVIVKNQVQITIPKGEKIKTVLYAWKPFSTANLVNEAGLPCSTFKLELHAIIENSNRFRKEYKHI
ncbi:MAG TPA: hypothetical protein PLV47_04865, partial [Flavobacterium sp.]|nr:hypothetical protein [Flavobacterium sp.]